MNATADWSPDGPPGRDLVQKGSVSLPRIGRAPEPPDYPVLDDGAEGIDVLSYVRLVLKHRYVIGGVVAGCVALGLLATLMMTPYYTSSVRLQIDRNAAKVVEGGNVSPLEGGQDMEFLKTQQELLQSRSMAERVVSALKLADNEAFLAPRQFSPWAFLLGLLKGSSESPTAADRQRSAADIIEKSFSLSSVRGSRLVDIKYADPEPSRAQKIIAAYADAYIASNLDKRFEANAYAKTFLEDQIRQLKLRVEASEKALIDFAQKEQIVAVNEKSSIAESNLAAANTALGVLISERIKNEEAYRQAAEANGANLPQILSNKAIETLRAARKDLTTEYQEKLETFKPGYPAMVQIRNKIAEIDRQLAAEIGAIKDSLKAAFDNSANQEAEMKKRIDDLRAELLDYQKRSVQYNLLKREADTNRSLYDGLLQRYKEVDIAGGVGANNIFIVDKASLPIAPSSPRISLNLALSLLAGLGLAGAVVFVLENLDDTLRTPEAVEQLTGLATIGIIPNVADPSALMGQVMDPRSAIAEAYRSLCTSLQFATESGLPKTLMVTSATPSEGKSITAVAIARHFATIGLKVLLVDADMRKPSLHAKLGTDNSIGLSTYLTGACKPPETFLQTDLANLALMTSGPLPPSAADLLGSARMMSLLTVGLNVFDLIVVDGPPVMGLADAQLLGNAVAGTVFVVGAGQARTTQVTAALKRLRFGNGSIIGAVLTKFDAKSAGYGYGDYGYGYGTEGGGPAGPALGAG